MLHDLRYAVRMLVKDRWFTLVAVLALGLGIGLNATVFTFVNAVLIRGLPFANPHEILHINGYNTAASNGTGVSWLDFEELRANAKTFASLAAYRGNSFTITENGRPPERFQGNAVSASTFTLLGQQPLLGRSFAEGDDKPGAAPVAILTHKVWMSRYGGDAAVVGRVVKVNDVSTTIVGVMPEGMRFPNLADMWVPLVAQGDEATKRENRSLNLFGRLARGATREQATTELTGMMSRLEQQFPTTNKNITVELMTFNERFNGGNIRMVFLALLGAVGFVLLIACANVANLLLARSTARAREIAVRFALGASRLLVVRQLLVESVLLACLGGLFGLVLAHFSVQLFEAAVADVRKPYWIRFTFDPTVFAYFAAICLITGIVFGLAPALQVSKTNVNDVLKEGGRGTAGTVRARWLVSVMVVAEITCTVVLLVGAGLMIRSFLNLYASSAGVETRPLLSMRVALPSAKYKDEDARRQFFDRLAARLQAIPGVQAATIATALPFDGTTERALEIDGRPVERQEDAPLTSVVMISPRYFDVMGLTMRRGRALVETDGVGGAENVVVSERFVSRFFPGEDVVGRRIRLVTRGDKPKPGPWLNIVGVSPTIRQGNRQNAEPDPVVYLAYRQESPGFANIITRSQVPAASLTGLVREAVQAVDTDLPVFQVRTLDEFIAEGLWPYRVFGSMFTIFAFIALVLSSVGVYAVTAYSVTQRTPEIGVRMALGARATQVSWLILKRGLVQLAIGLAIGLVLAWFASQILTGVLVQIPARDPVTFAGITAVLILVTLVACLVPARRATRLDPLSALRE